MLRQVLGYIEAFNGTMAPRLVLSLALLSPGLAFAAPPGQIEIWFRTFIPDPVHAGNAIGYIFDLPNAASKSVVRLMPADAVNPYCFATDHREFSTENQASSRLETRFTIRPQGMGGATIEPSASRTTAAPTTQVDCQTGATIDQKSGRVDRDHIGTPAVADGSIQVIGQAQGTNVIPAFGHGPSIDYSYDIKWKPMHGVLTAAITYSSFPAIEVYARVEQGSWTPVLRRLPTGSPWDLTLDGMGLRVEREVQTVQFNPVDGKWVSTDPDQRFSIEIKKGVARWQERSAKSGATLIREVPLQQIQDGTLRMERPNDAEVLAFLGMQPSLRNEILARDPHASFMILSIDADSLRADWNGLVATKDNNAHLKDLIQPGVKPAKPFDLKRQD